MIGYELLKLKYSPNNLVKYWTGNKLLVSIFSIHSQIIIKLFEIVNSRSKKKYKLFRLDKLSRPL